MLTILSFALVFSLTPVFGAPTYAAGDDEFYVGGTGPHYMSNSDSGTGWTWDSGSDTLTISGTYSGSSFISFDTKDPVKLVYNGDVNINLTSGVDNVIASKGPLTISGSGGTLNLGSTVSKGISAGGSLTIQNASLIATGQGGGLFGESITVTDATVTAGAVVLSANGIESQNGITFTDSKVAASAVAGGYALFAGNGLISFGGAGAVALTANPVAHTLNAVPTISEAVSAKYNGTYSAPPFADAIVSAIEKYYPTPTSGGIGTLSALADYDTVTVTKSLTGVTKPLELELPFGTKVIWDATLSSTSGSAAIIVKGGGILELVEGGSVSGSGDDSDVIKADGKSTILLSGGTVSVTGESSNAIHANGSNINITGGTVSAAGKDSKAIWADANSPVSISGGTVSASNNNYAILATSSPVTISGGTVSTAGAGSWAMHISNCSVDISNGKVSTSGDNSYTVFAQSGNINISGGTVSATGKGSYVIGNGNADEAKISISTGADIIGDMEGIVAFDKVEMPTAGQNGGIYANDQIVTLSTAVPGAAIYYTTDGSAPTTGSTLYSAPLQVTSAITLKAIAAKPKFINSDVLSLPFDLTAAKPVASPDGGTFETSRLVTLKSDTAGATIYYTTDGSAPTTGSVPYEAPFTLKDTATVNAIAVKSGYYDSEVLSVIFTRLAEETKPPGLTAISRASVKPIADKAYKNKRIKPVPVLKIGGKALKKGTDFTVSYKNNKKIGKATVKITGVGKYKGTKTVYFKIVPTKTSVSTVKAGKRLLSVTWKKVSVKQKVTGYQLRYRVKGTKKWKTKTAPVKSKRLTIRSLKKGKIYQVQVRSYKTVSKVKYCSAWSRAKTKSVK
jgi:hypothetical protein